MKRLLIPTLILVSLIAQAQTKRILFLGNSYTDYNNLPKITADIAASMGDMLIYDSNVPGGYRLEDHSGNTTSINKIKQGNWDFVVLQEQSQLPSFPISQVEAEVFPYARQLDSLINAHNACAETVFYMTWGRKNGDASNCSFWPPVCTYSGMDSLLRLRYMMMADDNDAVVSPVGAVWHYIRQHYPDIELYNADESHPSAAGSYAAACSFYTIVFRKDPSLIPYNFTLSKTEAEKIRTATKRVVFDSLSTWHVGEYDLTSNFSYSQKSGYTFEFTNLSKNATGQIWDFGSTTDTTVNPAFTFPGTGTYTVYLKSFNHCDTVIFQQDIVITETGINEVDEDMFTLFPNPTTGSFQLDFKNINNYIEIIITNVAGKVISSHRFSSKDKIQLNIDGAPGVYFAEIRVDQQQPVFIKVMKK